MATFETDSSSNPLGTYWKFHIRNKTKATAVSCDFGMCAGYNNFRQRSYGDGLSNVQPGEERAFNFDLLKTKDDDFWSYPKHDRWPTITFPHTVSYSASINGVSISGTSPLQVYSRFWNPLKSGGYTVEVEDFNINLIADGGWYTETDTRTFNSIKGYGYRVTVDAGGNPQGTLNIYYQVYDV